MITFSHFLLTIELILADNICRSFCNTFFKSLYDLKLQQMCHRYVSFCLLVSELSESQVHSLFSFCKNVKYTYYRKFFKVHMCQKLSKLSEV